MDLRKELLAVFADRSCFLCGEESAQPLCPDCVASFHSCDVGWVTGSGPSGKISGFSAYWYEGLMRKAILQMKVQGEYRLAGQLAALLCQKAMSLPWLQGPVVVPLPRFGDDVQFDRRHFPQVAARAVAVSLGGEAQLGVLRKVRKTHRQTELTDEQRLCNVEGTFAVNPAKAACLRGRLVVVVDDVITTGATIGAALTALIAAQPDHCLYLTLARSRATIQPEL